MYPSFTFDLETPENLSIWEQEYHGYPVEWPSYDFCHTSLFWEEEKSEDLLPVWKLNSGFAKDGIPNLSEQMEVESKTSAELREETHQDLDKNERCQAQKSLCSSLNQGPLLTFDTNQGNNNDVTLWKPIKKNLELRNTTQKGNKTRKRRFTKDDDVGKSPISSFPFSKLFRNQAISTMFFKTWLFWSILVTSAFLSVVILYFISNKLWVFAELF